ncbi:IS91 family transposase [Parashewanella spongiae]|nr:IS91 family transposase [Parashewanella spongiae]
MHFVDILSEHLDAFKLEYQHKLTNEHHQAMNAMLSCKTFNKGCSQWQCDDCHRYQDLPLSCGHRSCNLCQHNTTQDWLNRQQMKLLPVDYYMDTFTLPSQLRALTFQHQQAVFDAMFAVVASILKDFGRNKKSWQADIGFTCVLHTHGRQRQFHPHIHVIIPAGGYHKGRNEWRKNKGDYLFNTDSLAKVWRARMLEALNHQLKLKLPSKIPKKWVVNCRHVGKGLPALKYLSRYLYRGVLPDRDIVKVADDTVSFRYIDSETKQTQIKTLPTLKFLWQILQHVIPKGFRRVRDYGLLHGGASKTLKKIQLCLIMAHKLDLSIIKPVARKKAQCLCRCCQQPMNFLGITRPFGYG